MTEASPSERLTLLVERIVFLLAGQIHSGLVQRRTLNDPALWLVARTLRRVASRFAAVAFRLAAGTLRRPPVRAASAPPRKRPETPAKRLEWPYRLRATPGWLVRLIKPTHNLASMADFVHLLLKEPQTQAMLVEAPQLRRILSPLCTMLGIELPPIPETTADGAAKLRRRRTYLYPFFPRSLERFSLEAMQRVGLPKFA